MLFISDSNGDGACGRALGALCSRDDERWRGAVRDDERDAVWLLARVDVDFDDEARAVELLGFSDDERALERC